MFLNVSSLFILKFFIQQAHLWLADQLTTADHLVSPVSQSAHSVVSLQDMQASIEGSRLMSTCERHGLTTSSPPRYLVHLMSVYLSVCLLRILFPSRNTNTCFQGSRASCVWLRAFFETFLPFLLQSMSKCPATSILWTRSERSAVLFF